MADRTHAIPPRDKIIRQIEVDDSGCWIWTGRIGKDGYPLVRHKHNPVRAHRFAHEAFIGPIPSGFEVDHLCHVSTCVNPKHLEAVTTEENKRRALRDGRFTLPHGPPCPAPKATGLCAECRQGIEYQGIGRRRAYCSRPCKKRSARRREASRQPHDT